MSEHPRADLANEALQQSPYRYVIAALILAAHFSVGVSIFAVSPILLPIIGD